MRATLYGGSVRLDGPQPRTVVQWANSYDPNGEGCQKSRGVTCTLERRAYQAAAHLATACAAAAAGPIRARHDSAAVPVSGRRLRDDPLLAFRGRRGVQQTLRISCRYLADQSRHPLAAV